VAPIRGRSVTEPDRPERVTFATSQRSPNFFLGPPIPARTAQPVKAAGLNLSVCSD
jgi:hypothetical protein